MILLKIISELLSDYTIQQVITFNNIKKQVSYLQKKNKEVLNLNVGNVLRCHHSKFTNVTNVAVQSAN